MNNFISMQQLFNCHWTTHALDFWENRPHLVLSSALTIFFNSWTCQAYYN
jgi:hypothetical protein